MKIKFNVRSNTKAAYCIIVFAVCLLLVAIVFKYNVFLEYFGKLIHVLSPVIWALAIAYLLNPVVKVTEKGLKRTVLKNKNCPRLSRVIGISVAMLFLVGAMAAIIGSIAPEILHTLKGLFKNITTYFNNLQNYLKDKISSMVSDDPKTEKYLDEQFTNIQNYIVSAVNEYEPQLDMLLDKNGPLANITGSAWSFINGLKNFFLGLFISVYLLYSRDTLIANMKKIVYALFTEKHRKYILKYSARANYTFSRFLSGKAIDSLIIGVICFFGMLILGMRNYAVIISVLVGATNMIPFFGPIIGGVSGGLLILLTTPDKILVFVVFVFLLQQFDGNILGPKILGDSLGLTPFWVIFAIFVGGGIFGFAGMILVVPLFAVIYKMIAELVTERLKDRELPTNNEYYQTPYDLKSDSERETGQKKPEKKKKLFIRIKK